jgi:hypothetical protein
LAVSYAENSLSDGPLFLHERDSSPNSIDSYSIPDHDSDPLDPPSVDETETTIPPQFSYLPSHPTPYLQVSISGIPPVTDILSFAFLKPFGAVLEGRIVAPVLGSNQQTPAPGVVMFKILTHSTQCAKNLLALHEATGNSPTYSISVSLLFPLHPTLPHSCR